MSGRTLFHLNLNFSQQLLRITQNCTVNKQNLKQSHLCTLCCYGTEMILSKFMQN